jgi:hypothetical protein
MEFLPLSPAAAVPACRSDHVCARVTHSIVCEGPALYSPPRKHERAHQIKIAQPFLERGLEAGGDLSAPATIKLSIALLDHATGQFQVEQSPRELGWIDLGSDHQLISASGAILQNLQNSLF